MEDKGILYIVGTPIGNLKDITLRAIETLENVDIILAEDTRQTVKLLNHFNIKKQMISYHRHNEDEKINQVVSLLDLGKNIALVSDAGMPIISDPGQSLVKYLTQNSYKIETIPGVTALTTAIVKSGVDSTRFIFEGFLSINKKQRKEKLESIVNETRTIIFYEAPHKLLYTLKDLKIFLGDRKVCIARELTKIYEEFLYDNLSNLISKIEEKPLKGEIVLIVEGKNEDELKQEKLNEIENKTNIELVKKLINEGIDKKEAIKKVAKLKDINKNEVYKDCIDL
ncbi:MAG: 16S rRNA (cytidine(1402)-2'-O)-methyltransferase [Clostridia bacterium]